MKSARAILKTAREALKNARAVLKTAREAASHPFFSTYDRIISQ